MQKIYLIIALKQIHFWTINHKTNMIHNLLPNMKYLGNRLMMRIIID